MRPFLLLSIGALVMAQDVNDTYHGVTVADPFRWLENGQDTKVRDWSAAQNRKTREYLDALPQRAELKREIADVLTKSSVSYGSLRNSAGHWFALRRDPAQQQPVLVVLTSLEADREERALVDPNAMNDKALVSIDWFVPSPDGRLVAVSLSKSGSESGDVSIFDTTTGKSVHGVLPRVQGGTAGGSLAWFPDSQGFYYTRYPRAGERPESDMDFYQQVWSHRFDSTVDRYELGKDAPRIAEFHIQCDAKGRALVTMQNGDSGEFLHYLRSPKGEWKQITRYADRIVQMVLGPRDDLYAISTKDAPRGQLIRLAGPSPDPAKVQVLAPQQDAALVSDFYGDSPLLVTATHVFATYQLGGPEEIRAFSLDGKRLPGPTQLPVSSVGGLTQAGDDLVFQTVSYLSPSEWRRFSTETGQTKTTALVMKPAARFDDCEVSTETATSADGTRVPITVIRRKGTRLDGKNPALITAYGGFGVSLTPGFNPVLRPLLDRGFVYAIANLRGGGEFGEEWHDAGKLTRKQNVFDDFSAALKHLVARGYTAPDRLAIQGGSNGGLLMGATLTQHPGCCRAVVAAVGIYDMLRVERSPNGAFNVVEYGTVKEPDHFRALYAYSPYHRVKPGTAYPATLFMTGENDARVDPMHSRKMVARMQAATSSKGPVLLRTDADAGHGGGKPLNARIEELADIYAFVVNQVASHPKP